MVTIADVFIIETLDPDDEGNGRFEGGNICHVLRLHRKQPRYRYVRTRHQFREAVDEFALSNYRYLHISAHGDRDGMITTNLDEINKFDLARHLSHVMHGKRLFLSACSMVHRQMAGEIIRITGCTSVIGPRTDIGFTEAAVFWPAIYHLLFTQDSDRMTHAHLKSTLSKVANLFEVEVGYYAKSAKLKAGFSRDILKA